jgi:hypothetical protein
MSLWTPNQRTLTKTDHELLVEIGKGATKVLEFGPGYSTLAFIEAGVSEIVGLEHDPKWNEKQKERFKEFPSVTVDWYWNEAPVARVPDWVRGHEFDLAFVDSPKGYAGARVRHPGQEDCSRLNTCLAAIEVAPVVYLHDAIRPLERCSLARLEALGHKMEWVACPDGWKQQDESYGLARIIRNGKNQS